MLDSASILGRHEFAIRRLQSLVGLLPIGGYLCFQVCGEVCGVRAHSVISDTAQFATSDKVRSDPTYTQVRSDPTYTHTPYTHTHKDCGETYGDFAKSDALRDCNFGTAAT